MLPKTSCSRVGSYLDGLHALLGEDGCDRVAVALQDALWHWQAAHDQLLGLRDDAATYTHENHTSRHSYPGDETCAQSHVWEHPVATPPPKTLLKCITWVVCLQHTFAAPLQLVPHLLL